MSLRENIIAMLEQFRKACRSGNLEVAKRIYFVDSAVCTSANFKITFVNACLYDHLEVAQWLYSLDKEINADSYSTAFSPACRNNSFKTAKWLYQFGGWIFINREFIWACERNNLKLAQFIYSLNNKLNLHMCDNYLFRFACWHGSLELAQWLYLIMGKHIRELERDNSIDSANTQIMDWINTIKNNNHIAPNNNYNMATTNNNISNTKFSFKIIIPDGYLVFV